VGGRGVYVCDRPDGGVYGDSLESMGSVCTRFRGQFSEQHVLCERYRGSLLARCASDVMCIQGTTTGQPGEHRSTELRSGKSFSQPGSIAIRSGSKGTSSSFPVTFGSNHPSSS
jgi:hypothetical protein